MTEALGWLLLGSAVLGVAGIVYWLVIITEGVYLGPRFVAWLYDLSAGRYPALKGFDPEDEAHYLGRPLAQVLGGDPSITVLDVACGSGRVAEALLAQPSFCGQVVGLDLSRHMLMVARQRLGFGGGSGYLVYSYDHPLPFADRAFEGVTCVEALEFLVDPQAALYEMARVLVAGGWLLVTLRVGWEARLMPGHAWSRHRLVAALQALGMRHISITPWQTIYHLVWARKGWEPDGQYETVSVDMVRGDYDDAPFTVYDTERPQFRGGD